MVQISKRKLSNELIARIFELMFHTIGKKDRKEEFEKIINDLFSHTERIMIAKRIAIIYLIMKGIDKQSILDTLKVSSSTVAKFSLLVDIDSGIGQYFQPILRSEKLANMFEDILMELFLPTHRPGSNWSRNLKLKYQKEVERKRGI